MQMRWQLAYPGQPMPGGGILPESMAPGGVILPEYYIQLVTMHGTFMVFFAIMPLLVGVYANFLIRSRSGRTTWRSRASTCGRSGRSSRPGS